MLREKTSQIASREKTSQHAEEVKIIFEVDSEGWELTHEHLGEGSYGKVV